MAGLVPAIYGFLCWTAARNKEDVDDPRNIVQTATPVFDGLLRGHDEVFIPP
jgi:hypothetical protein